MNKFLIAVGLYAIIIPAMATTKCILPPTNCPSRVPSGNSRNSNWIAYCNNGNLRGIAVCSSKTGVAFQDSANDISYSSDTTQNLNCWCKMTYPTESYFVLSGIYEDAGTCASNCSKTCANSVYASQDFRNIIFSHLTN